MGDVPNAMAIKGDIAYIIVNNSGKIEIADQATLDSKGTITGLISPRNICFVTDYKAYVSSLYSDSITIINLSNNSIAGYINLRRTSESIAVAGNKAFISNWSGGDEIMVVNTLNDEVVDSIVLVRNLRVWPLTNMECSGSFAMEAGCGRTMLNLWKLIQEQT